jgi:MtrB/PioB family decaheme-associated outer membrane protein
MTQQERVRGFSRSALALAVCAAVASAQAQEKKEGEEKKSPVETQASVGVGVAGVSGDSADRAFWGQYNGMRNQDTYGLFNFDYSRRDTSTGTWLEVLGTNLGLQTRELGLLWSRQGDWRLVADYNELWRINPYTVNTGVTGAGTTTPSAVYLTGGAGSGGDYELSTKRKALGLGGSKWLGPELQLEASVNSENKNGTQLFGIGNSCPSTVAPGCTYTPGVSTGSAVLYYPLPIDYNHTQVEARLNYAGQDLQLSGGYYGSFFSNDNGALYPGVPSTLNNPVNQALPAGPGLRSLLSQQVALAPENSFNYFDLTGAYAFSPAVRANFKVAYSRATQDHEFSSAGLTGAPSGVGSLNGEVTSTLAQVRLVATPIAKLSLVAEYRYSDTEDNTPVVYYNQIANTSFTNQTISKEVNSGKIEATYRFPWSIQAMAGIGYTSIDRGTYTPTASYVGVSALRQDTDETTWWLQVRRSMTETLAGSISYISSSRDGSNWLAPAPGGVGLVAVSDPTTQLGPNAIYMPTMADLDRDKLRFLLTWMATDKLSVQFAADVGRDEYNAPSQYALQETKFDLYTLDVNYALSEAWNVNGYLSAGSQKLNQARPQGYILAFDEDSFNAGIGVSGKLSEKWQVGGTLSYISNVDKYAQTLGANAAPGSAQLLAATGGLPDITYRRTELRLFGSYTFSERSTVRVDAAYQHLTYDDWGYAYNGVPFLYSDNTSVYLQPEQNVGYIGVSYIYSWK